MISAYGLALGFNYTSSLIIALLGGAGFLAFRWQQQRNPDKSSNLETIPASRGELIATIGATGQVRSNQTTTLTWKTSGTVENVFVKLGDKLASLRQTSLPQSVILAQADLVSSQKALNDLLSNAENAKIQAMQTIANYTQAVKDAQCQLDNFTVPTQQIKLGAMEAVDIMNMNIMLVSVTERKHEIGLRKAYGAKRIDILAQFLTKSSLLCMFGDLVGIGLGVAISFLVGSIAVANDAPIDPSFGLDTVLLATLFSTAVDLFFGLYPANRAAHLEPVKALRYE